MLVLSNLNIDCNNSTISSERNVFSFLFLKYDPIRIISSSSALVVRKRGAVGIGVSTVVVANFIGGSGSDLSGRHLTN